MVGWIGTSTMYGISMSNLLFVGPITYEGTDHKFYTIQLRQIMYDAMVRGVEIYRTEKFKELSKSEEKPGEVSDISPVKNDQPEERKGQPDGGRAHHT